MVGGEHIVELCIPSGSRQRLASGEEFGAIEPRRDLPPRGRAGQQFEIGEPAHLEIVPGDSGKDVRLVEHQPPGAFVAQDKRRQHQPLCGFPELRTLPERHRAPGRRGSAGAERDAIREAAESFEPETPAGLP